MAFFRYVLSKGMDEELERADEKIEQLITIDMLKELAKLAGDGPSKYILYKIFKDESKKLFADMKASSTLEEILNKIFSKIPDSKVKRVGNQIVIEIGTCPLVEIRELNPEMCVVPIALIAGLVEAETGKKVKVVSPAGKFGLASADVTIEVVQCARPNGACEIRISGV